MSVAYIWSTVLQQAADQLPSNVDRSSVVHALSEAFELLGNPHDGKCGRAFVVAPDPTLATAEQLRRYHTSTYVGYLLGDQELQDSGSDSDSEASGYCPKRRRVERHGIEHDCPRFPLLPTYALQVASGTLTACRLLARGQADIAIHWDGGRHHALRNQAKGFCYIADIVLGIMLLGREGERRERNKPRVMYLDLDLHYGDGVALAFHAPTSYSTGKVKPPNVLTLSVHHSAPVFFPPTTPLSLLPSADTASPFTLSIPLHAYPSRATYAAIFPSIERIFKAYRPDYVVLQLGADGLTGDPIGRYGNLSTHDPGGMLWLAETVKGWGVPLCVLGGGGYTSVDTARAWAGVTAVMLGRQLSNDVPHHEYFAEYAPSFTMEVVQGSAKDENTPDHLFEIDERYKILASRIEGIVNA